MVASQPQLIIFAGANGAGKTTAAKVLLPKKDVLEFVNADEIAQGLSPLNPDGQRVRAGKLVIARMQELIAKKKNFAIETTLSGSTLAGLLLKARQQGYFISMFYIYTGDVRINIRRIRQRVAEGGHNVPAEDVKRRYVRGLHNLFHLYYDLCDRIMIYNMSGEKRPELVVQRNSRLPAIVASAFTARWKKMKKDAGVHED